MKESHSLQENYQVSIYTVDLLSTKRPTRKSVTQSLARAGTVKKKKKKKKNSKAICQNNNNRTWKEFAKSKSKKVNKTRHVH